MALRRFRQTAAKDFERVGKGEVTWSTAALIGGVGYQLADHKMSQEKSVNLLHHASRRLAAKTACSH